MFIEHATAKISPLQRSEMFIDIAVNSITRAPAERNVSGDGA